MTTDIVFILIFFLLVIGIMFVKTSESKQSFCKLFILSVWTVICIGAVLAYVMNIIKIPIMLRTMTVAYSFCSALVWSYLLTGRSKRIQKVEFVWSEFFSFVFCSIVWGIVFVKTFGFDLSVAYNGSDASTHFNMAKQILNTHKLNKMYFAALYNSLVMEMLQPFLIRETLYKAFIIADATLNLLNILIFYILASQFTKTDFSKFALKIILVFYFLGWPVWSWIAGGFVYFGTGVTAYMYGVYLLERFDKNQYKPSKKYYIILMGITLFCIIQCYLLFSPIFIFTILIYVLYKVRGKITKKMIGLGFTVLIVIGLITFILIYYGFFGGDINYVFKAFRTDGGVHREFYKDFMFLLPINMYYLSIRLKQKDVDILSIAIVCQLMITLVALLANLCGFMSDYYYYKLYYLGWALQFAGVLQAINYFWYEKRQVIYYCICPILISAVLEVTGLSQTIIWSTTGNTEMFPVITQSIGYVRTLYEHRKGQKDCLVIVCRWINENIKEEQVPLVAVEGDTLSYWYNSFLIHPIHAYIVREDSISNEERLQNMLASFHELNCQYFTILLDMNTFSEYIDKNGPFTKVYEDSYYRVYEIKE